MHTFWESFLAIICFPLLCPCFETQLLSLQESFTKFTLLKETKDVCAELKQYFKQVTNTMQSNIAFFSTSDYGSWCVRLKKKKRELKK